MLLVRFLLALTFLSAGAAKLRSTHDFVGVVRTFRVVGEGWVEAVARWLPRIEIMLGVLLVAGLGVRYASLAVGALLGLFIVVTVWNLARKRIVRCGCFGSSSSSTISWSLVVRNALMLLGADLLVVAPARSSSLDSLWLDRGTSPSPWDAVLELLAASCFMVSYTIGWHAWSLHKRIKSFSRIGWLPQ